MKNNFLLDVSYQLNHFNELLTEDKMFDLQLVLIDLNNNQLTLKLHKIILWINSPFFRKLLTSFSDYNKDIITINVSDSYVMKDIIMTFYLQNIKSIDYPDWRYLFECIKCYDYLCIPYNYDNIYDIEIPSSKFNKLLEILPYLNDEYKIYKLVRKGMPLDYDLSLLSHDLLEKLTKYKFNCEIVLCTTWSDLNFINIDNNKNSNIYMSYNYNFYNACYLSFSNNNKYLICGNMEGEILLLKKNFYSDMDYDMIKNVTHHINISKRVYKIIPYDNNNFVICHYKRLYGGNESIIEVWKISDDNTVDISTIKNDKRVIDLTIIEPHKLVTIQTNQIIKIYDLNNNNELFYLELFDVLNNTILKNYNNERYFNSGFATYENLLVIGCYDNSIKIFDIYVKKIINTLTIHQARIVNICNYDNNLIYLVIIVAH